MVKDGDHGRLCCTRELRCYRCGARKAFAAPTWPDVGRQMWLAGWDGTPGAELCPRCWPAADAERIAAARW